MSKIEVNTVAPQCGTTLTLGESGDTVTLGSGASQSGFGRTGTVNWQTSVKTNSDSPLTVENGKGYFLNTTSGTITVNLPAGSAGDIVAFKDYANTWDNNNVLITPNGSDKIGGTSAVTPLSTESQSVTLIFVDSTKGWMDIHDSTSNVQGAQFITATGGTITTVCTNFKVHTFTSPGTFCVSAVGNPAGSDQVSYMVVAGGGGSGGDSGGGGGGGGFREGKSPQTPYVASPIACTTGSGDGGAGLPVSVAGYPITIGAGGSAGAGAPPGGTPAVGGDGSASTFAGSSTITSAGGGGGGSRPAPDGRPGGSGGGARSQAGAAGNGNTPPVSPAQGFNGAGVAPTPGGNSGGGGGATALGIYASSCSAGGPGGAGATTQINGSPNSFSGGGGGGGASAPANVGGTGGVGGGGNGTQGAAGGAPATAAGNPGTTNTGGGAGGGGDDSNGAAGGSGIVIIRYKFQ